MAWQAYWSGLSTKCVFCGNIWIYTVSWMWCFQRLKWAIMQHFPHPGVYSVLKPHFSHEWWESLSTPAWLFLLYQDVGLSLSFSHICGYRQRLRGAVWMWDGAALFSTGYGWSSGSGSSSRNCIMYSQQATRCLAASLLISIPIPRYCGCWGIYPGSIWLIIFLIIIVKKYQPTGGDTSSSSLLQEGLYKI